VNDTSTSSKRCSAPAPICEPLGAIKPTATGVGLAAGTSAPRPLTGGTWVGNICILFSRRHHRGAAWNRWRGWCQVESMAGMQPSGSASGIGWWGCTGSTYLGLVRPPGRTTTHDRVADRAQISRRVHALARRPWRVDEVCKRGGSGHVHVAGPRDERCAHPPSVTSRSIKATLLVDPE